MLDHPNPDLETVRAIVEQVAKGLRAFHRMEMLHQDVIRSGVHRVCFAGVSHPMTLASKNRGDAGIALPHSTLKSLGSQSGLGCCGFMASKVSRTTPAMAALRAHLRSAGMTYQGAHVVEHFSSITL